MATKFGKIKMDLFTIMASVGNDFSITQFCTDTSGQPLDGIYFPRATVAHIGRCPQTWCLTDGELSVARIEIDRKSEFRRALKAATALFGDPETNIEHCIASYIWRSSREEVTIITELTIELETFEGFMERKRT
jgi:hypothetical protein